MCRGRVVHHVQQWIRERGKFNTLTTLTSRARILYFEDDINLSFVTRDNLEAACFAVHHCTSGAEGWAAFQAEPFDLCLLDVMFPQTDGFTLARQIRAVNPNIPILFLSARADRADRLTGLRLGADDYLTKPFSIDELLLKIDMFLKRSQATRYRQSGTLGTTASCRRHLPVRSGKSNAKSLGKVDH